MTVLRQNIMNNDVARDQFLEGVRLLDQANTGVMASDVFRFLQQNNIPLPMQGIEQELSVYDVFVLWHIVAMSIPFETGNGAHSGPIFLPWHRMYMIRLEESLQNVLGDDTFGLPYWDWAEDGELHPLDQRRTALWSADFIGESRGVVRSGQIGSLRVRIAGVRRQINGVWSDVLESIDPRQLERLAGSDIQDLPMQSDVQLALDEPEYDRPSWSQSSFGHRNRLEGWLSGRPPEPQLHNRVHVWVGGDMGPGTSPNDPVFFLNHCNVDRIWEAWMANTGRDYRPQDNEGSVGHRLNDLMIAIIGDALRPSDVLNPAQWYAYDSLQVA